jgi:arylsulfatase A-like enzyme
MSWRGVIGRLPHWQKDELYWFYKGEIMRYLLLFFLLSSNVFFASAQTRHVVLISIDGLHPDMYLDPSWPTPNLRYLMQQGTYANYLKGVFPSYTYPTHTAMVTGALPARSKILFNQPVGNHGEWYWYAKDIKVPTLWQKLHELGMTTAALNWPVTVGAEIDFNLPEMWDIPHPYDRITVARHYVSPAGFVEEMEQNATGRLDTVAMDDGSFLMDENLGRMAAYLIEKHKPAFLALHVVAGDAVEHDYGRDADSVRLALAADDRIVGEVLAAIQRAGLRDSTALIVIGDHGFATYNQAFRPNLLIKGIPVRFVSAGGSAFLYPDVNFDKGMSANYVSAVIARLDSLPKDKRKLFRIIGRKELDLMGADSSALLALTGVNGLGLVFSGATAPAKVVDNGLGTLTQQSPLQGIFYPVHGGHHGYDPDNEEMHTGFIAYGAEIQKGGHIDHLSEPDIAVLIARLLRVEFKTPDGRLVPGVLR